MRRPLSINRLAVLCLTLLGTAATAEAQDQRPDCHILSVGIDAYAKGPLKGCVNDARNIANVFAAQEGKLFGRVSTNLLVDDQATKQGIDAGMAGLRQAGKAGDFVVLFLSGHGSR